MAEVRPPTQIRLTPESFPKEPWAKELVGALNQFSVETVQAINVVTTTYRDVAFVTGALPSDSFPIDIPCERRPNEVRIAQLLSGQPEGVPGILWQPLSGGQLFRVTLISSLAANTTYRFRLAID